MRRCRIKSAKLPAIALACTLSCVGADTSNAGPIVSVGGDLVEIPTPASLKYTGIYSGFTFPAPVIFNEFTNKVVPVIDGHPPIPSGQNFLDLDIKDPGTYPPGPSSLLGQLASGTTVSSFIVNFEPSDTSPVGSVFGSVTFATDVIGIQTRTLTFNTLRNTSLWEGSSIRLGSSTGLELDFSDPLTSDWLILSDDRRTISFGLNLNGATDNFRIFVAPMPEPMTLTLFGAGLAGSATMVRRRSKKSR